MPRRMTDNRLSGLALITGTVGSIITMALHPTGHIAAADIEPMIRMLIAVHALALACVPLLFIGAMGLSQQLASSGRLAVTGLVLYTFALVAVMNAAVADGLVTPSVLRQIVASAGSPAAIDGWRMMSHYNFYVNQAYAQVFVAASAVAILLWSISIWRGRELTRNLGIYGCILAPVTLLALFSGRLKLDAHGFGMVVFTQAVWFIIAGILLMQSENPVGAAAA
jgi:hypothetical protein